MKAQDGEFWIVEAFGKVTVAQCRPNMTESLSPWRWRLFDGSEVSPTHRDFRAVRKIDVGALLDGDPVTVTSLSRLLLGAIVEAGAPLRPPRIGEGAHVRISKSTQERLNPSEWRTVITSDARDGAVMVEAVRIAETIRGKT